MSEEIITEVVEPVAAAIATPVLTPGGQLRAAREARGLSLSEVAQVIRFSPRQIEALERDDYALLPGATAVRGFVRSYAKLLRLDPTPLLAELDQDVPSPSADVRPPVNMGEAEIVPLAERFPLRLALVGVAVVLLGVFWYFTQPTNKPAAPELPAAESVAAPAVAAPTPSVVPATTAADVAQGTAAAPAAASAPAVSAAAVPAPAAPTTAPVAPFNGLRIEFDGRSWIEVRDVSQRVVFVGEYSAGTKQNVEGKAPFQVWIGKASAVRVSYGDRAVDLKPHTREEVARLTIE